MERKRAVLPKHDLYYPPPPVFSHSERKPCSLPVVYPRKLIGGVTANLGRTLHTPHPTHPPYTSPDTNVPLALSLPFLIPVTLYLSLSPSLRLCLVFISISPPFRLRLFLSPLMKPLYLSLSVMFCLFISPLLTLCLSLYRYSHWRFYPLSNSSFKALSLSDSSFEVLSLSNSSFETLSLSDSSFEALSLSDSSFEALSLYLSPALRICLSIYLLL